MSVLCKNGRYDRDAAWGGGSGESKEQLLDGIKSRSTCYKGQIFVEEGRCSVMYVSSPMQKKHSGNASLSQITLGFCVS